MDALEHLELPVTLESVGTLAINSTTALTSVDADHLVSIGRMEILYNFALVTLDHFGSLTTLSDGIWIAFNPELEEISGFDALTVISKGLTIEENDALTDLSGFEGVTKITGFPLEISGNDALQNLDGFKSLKRVGDDIQLLDNDALSDVTGLNAVTTVTGDLIITGNHSLADADATALYVEIGDANIDGSVTISDNGG